MTDWLERVNNLGPSLRTCLDHLDDVLAEADVSTLTSEERVRFDALEVWADMGRGLVDGFGLGKLTQDHADADADSFR